MAQQVTDHQTGSISSQTARLAEYVAAARTSPVPPDVADKAALHVADTLAAVISGACLPPGQRGAAYVRGLGGSPVSTVVGARLRTDPVSAALANGMSAHADETDDSHAPSISHPGCAVVPAALAVAEERRAGGTEFLRAVVAGYDVGPRVVLALGTPRLDTATSGRSTHALVGLFGATAAAAVLYGLDEQGARHALSYAAQSASGVTSWVRDGNHVEKAFVFGGMPASNGVRAAAMVASGCDGVDDVFAGRPNVLDALSTEVCRDQLVDGLGERYEVTRTNIKKFPVGSPAQAAVQATLDLLEEGEIDPAGIADIEIVLPHDLARVVDGRSMPDINCQYLVVGTLLDRGFSFAMAHDAQRMTAPDVVALLARTRLRPDPEKAGVRTAEVTIRMSDGTYRRRYVPAVRGTVDDPMTRGEVEAKVLDLVVPLIGQDRADTLLTRLWSLSDVEDVTELVPLVERS
jgi:2-methylcitrate dehydratase PrpD